MDVSHVVATYWVISFWGAGGGSVLYGSEPSAQIATKGNRTLFPHHSWALTYCRLVIHCNSHIGKALVAIYYLSAVAPQTVDELRKLYARTRAHVG